MVGIEIAKSLFDEARKFIPGGVNSPVRSFRAVGGYPVFIKQGKGSKIYGECDKEFIDYCMSWGVLILGHANPKVTAALLETIKQGTSFGTATRLEIELAKLIVEAFPSIEQIRLTNSGTEAVMGAIRLARAYTKKDKIIKFEGAYHGHADYLLVKAGSGQATLGIPASAGVPKDFIKHTLVLPYNDIEKVKETVKKYQKDLAAVIVEPVLANCGVVLPEEGFLQSLRKIADKYNIVLIFDEVITGFRLSYTGAQGYFKVKPDLTCLGKIIGGGLPVGAFGGKKEIMQLLAPEGPVYQAGTLSGNPIAVSAGIATLNILKKDNPYPVLEKRTKKFCGKIEEKASDSKIKLKINHIGSIFSLFFSDKKVMDFSSAKTQDVRLFKKFFHSLLKSGVYFSPSAFEANFLSTAHSVQDLDRTLEFIGTALKDLRR
ncbi:MAG: glutamate-1-semialdehyde-2,1-aminomutase [Candidatus Omnitrophica bacterium CG07_land_8_20_14_0_80_42_15]|uniref:Glutamate-1-semialdehyde 2,1-aminomutase n=1 Tax=Candidatus Aquitaenariimonas noxiae TaxID=1974741 RepID=A0A2J0L337_9BACT|nr:MAG: glutamate-1-semialdehyde-2,1-aminomutase [Candidatus Omnitrophica bacterium CG07_land_8_20_14_0_80_42_15]